MIAINGTFSENFKKEHPLSKIDPRIKLLAAGIILMMALSAKGFAFPLLVISLSFIACLSMKIPLRTFLLRFSEPMFIAFILVTIKFLFSGNESALTLNLFGLKLTGHGDGLREGLKIAGRIFAAVSIVSVLGFATPFMEFMAGLSWFSVPKQFIEIMTHAYRYIFVLLEDAMVIYNAQKNRLGYSNIRRGLNSFGVLAGSLTLKAFDHSEDITVAMTQRGYDGNMPLAKQKPLNRSEVAGLILFSIMMGAAWKI